MCSCSTFHETNFVINVGMDDSFSGETSKRSDSSLRCIIPATAVSTLTVLPVAVAVPPSYVRSLSCLARKLALHSLTKRVVDDAQRKIVLLPVALFSLQSVYTVYPTKWKSPRGREPTGDLVKQPIFESLRTTVQRRGYDDDSFFKVTRKNIFIIMMPSARSRSKKATKTQNKKQKKNRQKER
jgi:hypothetical protein